MRTRRSQSSSDPVSSAELVHRSVLLHEAIDMLAIEEGDVVIDATLGGAGHAREIARHLGDKGVLIGFDLDSDAIERAREALKAARPTVHLVEANFQDLDAELKRLSIETIDKAIFDLGWSSFQLDAGRGFSFSAKGGSALGGQKDELLMTYAKDPVQGALTARTIVNEWAEESIADVIFGWGQERYARRIAKRIVEARERGAIETSRQLAEIIRSAVPAAYRFGRIHPATKTFQALRIAVNDEFGATEKGIRAAWEHLTPGGRLAVISFHSIEDALVKRIFKELAESGGELVSKKPIQPGEQELAENPRARSAKLRVIQKTP